MRTAVSNGRLTSIGACSAYVDAIVLHNVWSHEDEGV